MSDLEKQPEPKLSNEIEGTMAPPEAADRMGDCPIDPPTAENTQSGYLEAFKEANGRDAETRDELEAWAIEANYSPPPPVLPPEEAMRAAVMELDAARYDHGGAKRELQLSRQRLGTALAAYNAAAPKMTPEANVRQWIASNQARRAAIAEAGRVPYQPSVTETAKALGGGGHGNDKRALRGGGPAYRRGPGGVQAFSKVGATQANAARARDAYAARMNGGLAPRTKLPSDR